MAKRIRMEDSVVDVPNKRRRMESSVAERVVQQELLPRDVQFQILSRLPVKPLMRCKLVCKSWSSRIRDPLFARAHQTIHKNQDTVEIYIPHREKWDLACAGVVCHYSDDDEPVHIFNPCTREVLTIPMQRSSNHVSLGFSSLTNEYKVLRGRKSPFESYKLEILSLGGGGDAVMTFAINFKGEYNKIKAMDFWILKDYQNQVWFKDSIIFPEPRNDLGYPQPVGSIHTGELLLTACKKGHGFVHLYDMKLKTYNKTEIVLPEGSLISAAGYDETIFPLK
ncbi:hypothetical protein ACLB2K_070711 [Fragaria x ananassa]